jgi:hypothetical protein
LCSVGKDKGREDYFVFQFKNESSLVHCWWGCKLVQPLWKKIWRLLKNLNIDLPYDPAIPLLGINPKNAT